MKRTPQARYQAALRVIKTREGVSHKLAQQIYRDGKATGLAVKYPTTWREIQRDRLKLFTAAARRIIQTELFAGRSFGWDLRDTGAVAVKGQGAYAEMTAQIRIYHGGIFKKTVTVTRKNVAARDFWTSYHDMVRQAVEGAYEDDDGEDVSAETVHVAAL